ncbi:hypothetical protein Tco_0590998 [Tanacetum coccineum]
MSRSSETSDLFEELIAEFGLDDSIPTKIDDRYHDSEGDILYFEQLLNEDTSFDVSLNKVDLDVYNALLDVVARDERIDKKDTYKKDSFRKRSYNDQDPHNREGEKKKKQKVIGRSSSGKGPTITKPANDILPSTTDQPQDYEMNSKDIGSDWIDEDSPKEYEWFEMMVNPHKDPKDDETPQEGSTIAFAKHLKYNIKVDKLTKDELKGSREKDSIL